MEKTAINGCIALCKDHISDQIYKYELEQNLEPNRMQQYGVLFLPNSKLTRVVYFRWDSQNVIVQANFYSGFLAKKPTTEPIPENIIQVFNDAATVFIKSIDGNFSHKLFRDLDSDTDLPNPNDSSSFHTFNYIYI